VIRRGLAAVLIVLAFAGGVACERVGTTGSDAEPEAELEAVVRDVLRAIPQRDAPGVLRHIAYDFRADDGVDYPAVQALLFEFLERERVYSADLEELSIEPTAREGELELHALVRFSRADGGGPSPLYRMDLVFAKLGDTWSARRGRYRRVDP
jgi:hypothetical protein